MLFVQNSVIQILGMLFDTFKKRKQNTRHRMGYFAHARLLTK